MAKKSKYGIEQLREEVRKQHRAAGQKVSRLKARGVDIGGTGFDIRRDIAKVKRYNMQQLNAYLNELMGFTSRSNQFVAGSQGSPLPRNRTRYYQSLERRVNEIGRKHDESVGDVFIPFSGMTVKERMAMLHPLERFSRDTPRPYTQFERKMRNVEDAQSLEKLIAQMEKKLNKDATIEKSVKQTKKNFRKILKEMGASDLAERINRLTTNQADILFNYTSLADIVANPYADWKEFRAGGKEEAMAATVNDARRDIVEILDWATSIGKKKK